MPEKHILHIEDNFHNRRIVRKILEKQGYILHEAADGVIGFNMIQEMQPPMVLLDISLPGLDGIEIAQKVKGDDNLKHIIIIAVTASAMQGDRERFLAAGCDDYLSKPFRSIDLLDLVNQYYAEIPESHMTSFRPKDVIHPIEEHSVLAEPESWTRANQTHEEIREPFTPITEDTLAEPERQFFTRKEEAPQPKEPTDEPIESSQDNGLLKTASLEGLLTNEELDRYLEEETPVEKKVEEVEEAPPSMPTMAFAGEAESEEKEEEDDEIVTWVMPRNAVETSPVEEEHPMEELAAEPVEPWEYGGVTYKTFLEEISSEDALDEDLLEETPEPAAAEESDETTQVWGAPAKMDEIELDTDFLQPSVLEETRGEDLIKETPEPVGDEESDETTLVWRASLNTDELDLDTDFLQPSVLEEAPEEVKDETTPTLASPTKVVEKLMSFSGEEPAVEPEPDLEEEQATPAVLLEELTTPFPEGEDVLTAEPASETEEEALTEPAASIYDEIETIGMGAREDWDVGKELEVDDFMTEEPALETEEELSPEPASSIDDEIETIKMDTGGEWKLENEIETEAHQKIAMHSRLDDTSPLKGEVLEASMAEEPRSESPSNGSGREEQSPKKEEKSAQKNDLTDQVVRMINPDMIRPVDPNVGV